MATEKKDPYAVDMTPPGRVAAGAALLDSHGPGGWRSKVNLKTFNIESDSLCVLGQVFGSYEQACKALGLKGVALIAHGFVSFDREVVRELGYLWRNEIERCNEGSGGKSSVG